MRYKIDALKQTIKDRSQYNKEKSQKHGEVFTPFELIDDMLDTLPAEIWSDKTKTFFDPCAGLGNFPISLIGRLFDGLKDEIPDEYQRLKHIVENQIYMGELQHSSANFIRDNFDFDEGFRVNLYEGDTLKMPEDFFLGEGFDIIVGNPPYNKRDKKIGFSGLGGNNTIYRDFIKESFKYLKENGVMVMVTLKRIFSLFNKIQKQLDEVNLMTETNYWKYNTLFFKATNKQQDIKYRVKDRIFDKIFTGDIEWNAGFSGKSFNQYCKEGAVIPNPNSNIIVKLPGRQDMIYGDVVKLKPVLGPKFVFTWLESKKSYTATDNPVFLGSSCIVKTETLEQAEKLKLFVSNNSLMKFAHKKLKTRGFAETIFYIKKFDLDQIQTGYEYPKEFGLTLEDIAFIETSL